MVDVPVLSVAHAARAIADRLIPEHHLHLAEAEILYIFTDQKRKKCDRVKVGSAAKMNALQRFLASGLDGVDQGPNFLILIDSVWWDVAPPSERAALIDHELCHCAMFVNNSHPPQWRRILPHEIRDDFADWRWGLRGHDIEEFAAVLKRHGFWRRDEAEHEFEEIALQLVMPTSSNSEKREVFSKEAKQAAEALLAPSADGTTVSITAGGRTVHGPAAKRKRTAKL